MATSPWHNSQCPPTTPAQRWSEKEMAQFRSRASVAWTSSGSPLGSNRQSKTWRKIRDGINLNPLEKYFLFFWNFCLVRYLSLEFNKTTSGENRYELTNYFLNVTFLEKHEAKCESDKVKLKGFIIFSQLHICEEWNGRMGSWAEKCPVTPSRWVHLLRE